MPKKGLELTEQQIRLIEKANLCLKERHVESSYPGQLLCQDTFYVGRPSGSDSYRQRYRAQGPVVIHMYEIFLKFNDIEHRPGYGDPEQAFWNNLS